jgi:hypothetical protein
MINKILASIKALDKRTVYTGPVIAVDKFNKRVQVRILSQDLWVSYSPTDIPDLAEKDHVAIGTVDNKLLAAFVVCRVIKMVPSTLGITVV